MQQQQQSKIWLWQIIDQVLMEEDYEMLKIVVIGSMGTGKTNISTVFMKNQFIQSSQATVGVEFMSKIMKIKNKNIKINLWDTAGQQRFKSLSKVYYKGASAILVVYDVTDPQSYLDVQSWMRLANQNLNLDQVALILVGNKIDLQNRKVTSDRVESQYKQKFDIDCWEVSAKTGLRINQMFQTLIQKIITIHTRLKASQAGFYESNFNSSIVGENTFKDIPKPNLPPISTISMIFEEDQNQNEDKITKQNQIKLVRNRSISNHKTVKIRSNIYEGNNKKSKDCQC